MRSGSTAGARHVAESEQWLAAERERQEWSPRAYLSGDCSTCTLAEAAAAHDGQPVIPWAMTLLRRFEGK